MDPVSRHPHNDDETKIERGSDYEEVEVISYSSICEVADEYLNTTKVPDDLKKEVPSISCMVQSIIEEEDAEVIQVMLNSVLNQVTPKYMVEEQYRYSIHGLVCTYVTAGEKLK